MKKTEMATIPDGVRRMIRMVDEDRQRAVGKTIKPKESRFLTLVLVSACNLHRLYSLL
jgi:hypothetical protein